MIEVGASTSMGRPAYFHDLRITHTNNVDVNLSKDNVILIDSLKGKDLDTFLNELLQPYVDEYNDKQKRKDRKVDIPYTEWHKLNDNKGEMVYEFVMQYGEHNDLGKKYYEGTDEDRNKMRDEYIKVYTKWLDDWTKQHPNQKVLWSTIHFDENMGTPHMHLAVVPLSHNFKRGFKTQISMSKSLEDDGFKRLDSKKENFQLVRAFEKFREVQERDLKELGYDIKERKGGPHLEPEAYKEKMMEAEMKAAEIIKETVELKQEATEKLEKIISLESEMKELEEIQERTPIFDKSNVVVKDVKVGGMFSKETTKIVELDYDDYKTFSISIDSKNLNKKTHEKIEKGEKIMKKYADMMMSDKEKELLLKVDELENKLFAAEKTIKERDREIINQNRLIQKLNDFIDRTRELLHKYAPRLEQILWPNGDEDQKRNEHENNYDEFEFER